MICSNRLLATLLPCVAMAVAGCYPREMIIWSPDGRQALVVTADKTYLCDAHGKLVRVDGVKNASAAGWLPDSKSIVIAHGKSVETWAQIAAVLNPQDRQLVVSDAKAFEAAIVAKEGPATEEDLADSLNAVFGGWNSYVLPAALLYLREQGAQPLREKLGERAAELDKLKADYAVLQQFYVNDLTLEPGLVVLNTVRGISELRVSPDGLNVLYVQPAQQEYGDASLYVVPIASGAAPTVVAKAAASYPDWAADGRHVIYISPIDPRPPRATYGPFPPQVGAIRSREVSDAGGRLLAKLPDPQDLAALCYGSDERVRSMNDGRILCCGTGLFSVPGMQLFVLKAGGWPTPLLSRREQRDVPAGLNLFESSPDQTQISVPGDKGEVFILDIANGLVTSIQEYPGKKPLVVPTWRTTGELCLVLPPGAPKGSPNRPEVALYKGGNTHIISRDWPDEAVRFTEPDSQPTSQPATVAK